jgi:hypothetical protein
MNKHWELHQCENMPKTGVQVLYSMDHAGRKAKTWRLIVRREATENDLQNNHILEEEGETLWETHLEIVHCPYCGEKLFKLDESNFEEFGQFEHCDYSEWHTKRQ